MLSYLHMRNAFGDEDEISELPYRGPRRVILYRDHPEQCRAYDKVRYAIKAGWLVPQPCEICDVDNLQCIIAHHQDYSKPLDVNWLCWSCHEYVHVIVREVVFVAKAG